MRESSGKKAASVFPPAVGASTTQSSPSRMASIACSCTGRSDRHPSVLTIWYWSAPLSFSKASPTARAEQQIVALRERRRRLEEEPLRVRRPGPAMGAWFKSPRSSSVRTNTHESSHAAPTCAMNRS